MANYSIAKKKSSNIQEIELNEYGDVLRVNATDATWKKKFVDFTKYVYDSANEAEARAIEQSKKFEGRDFVYENSDGEEVADVEQMYAALEIEHDLYQSYVEKIGELFGEDVLAKYFRAEYELDPDYLPNDAAIGEFVQLLIQAINTVYNDRNSAIKNKYSPNKKGQRR